MLTMTSDDASDRSMVRVGVLAAVKMTVVLAIMIGILLLLGHGPLERWMPPAIMLIVSWPTAVVGRAAKARKP